MLSEAWIFSSLSQKVGADYTLAEKKQEETEGEEEGETKGGKEGWLECMSEQL